MSIIAFEFGREKKVFLKECGFVMQGMEFRLVCREDGYGVLLGVDLTCKNGSSAKNALTAIDAEKICSIIDRGCPLSSGLSPVGTRIHKVYLNDFVDMASAPQDAALQILVRRYESFERDMPTQNKQVGCLRVFEGGMA